jgi:hypothetical protein
MDGSSVVNALTGCVDFEINEDGSIPTYTLENTLNDEGTMYYDSVNRCINVYYHCSSVVTWAKIPDVQQYQTILLPIFVDDQNEIMPFTATTSFSFKIYISYLPEQTDSTGNPLAKTIKQGSLSNMGGIGVKLWDGALNDANSNYEGTLVNMIVPPTPNNQNAATVAFACRVQIINSITNPDQFFMLIVASAPSDTTSVGVYTTNLGDYGDGSIDCYINSESNFYCQNFMAIPSTYCQFNSVYYHSIPNPIITTINNNEEDSTNSYKSNILFL